jgi:hypothetical protein
MKSKGYVLLDFSECGPRKNRAVCVISAGSIKSGPDWINNHAADGVDYEPVTSSGHCLAEDGGVAPLPLPAPAVQTPESA